MSSQSGGWLGCWSAGVFDLFLKVKKMKMNLNRHEETPPPSPPSILLPLVSLLLPRLLLLPLFPVFHQPTPSPRSTSYSSLFFASSCSSYFCSHSFSSSSYFTNLLPHLPPLPLPSTLLPPSLPPPSPLLLILFHSSSTCNLCSTYPFYSSFSTPLPPAPPYSSSSSS